MGEMIPRSQMRPSPEGHLDLHDHLLLGLWKNHPTASSCEGREVKETVFVYHSILYIKDPNECIQNRARMLM